MQSVSVLCLLQSPLPSHYQPLLSRLSHESSSLYPPAWNLSLNISVPLVSLFLYPPKFKRDKCRNVEAVNQSSTIIKVKCSNLINLPVLTYT